MTCVKIFSFSKAESTHINAMYVTSGVVDETLQYPPDKCKTSETKNMCVLAPAAQDRRIKQMEKGAALQN